MHFIEFCDVRNLVAAPVLNGACARKMGVSVIKYASVYQKVFMSSRQLPQTAECAEHGAELQFLQRRESARARHRAGRGNHKFNHSGPPTRMGPPPPREGERLCLRGRGCRVLPPPASSRLSYTYIHTITRV